MRVDKRPDGECAFNEGGEAFTERDGVYQWLEMGGIWVFSREKKKVMRWNSESEVDCGAK